MWLIGCPGADDSPSTTDPVLTGSASNGPVINSAVDAVDRMLQAGDTVDEINAALLTELQADERVLGAGVDTDEGVVWVDLIDGESHCFLVVDEAQDAAGTLKALHDPPDTGQAKPAPAADRCQTAAAAGKTGAVAQGTASGLVYTQPASNKALLANALSFIHGNWDISDTTDVVQTMLAARGYEVERHDLTVDDFANLTHYGVILIETHGTWRNPQYPPELIQLPPELGIPYTGTCGGDFSRQTLLTTTPVTQANLLANYGDVMCGRLTIWNVTIRRQDGSRTRRQYYGVTPNYVREHDKGTFPNNTLFYLNACRAYRDDFSSAYRDMLYEKCGEGACFLGWSGKVFYPRAARATLYIYQLLTASNEEKIVAGQSLLEKFTPPQGGAFTFLLVAMSELNQKLYLTDPHSGAQLTPWLQDNATIMPILAPHPRYCNLDSDGKWQLRMFGCDKPALTVDGKSITASKVIWWGDLWNLSGLSTGLYGDVVASENGVTGLSRPLRRWRPQIQVSGNSNGLQYTVTFTAQARATLDVDSFRASVWQDPPAASFADTYWDRSASAIAWNITGQQTTTDYHYVYSGSGARAFQADDGGSMLESTQGTGVNLTIYGRVTYTVTTTDLHTNAVTTSQQDQLVTVSRQGVAVSDNLTVAGASFQQNVGFGGQAQVSWSAFGPTPAFDPNTEPR